MPRRTTQTYDGWAQPDVLVTVDGIEHQGNLRAWTVDDETGDWWGQCQYPLAPGQQTLGWIHQDQLRRDGNLNDNDGLVSPSKVIALHDRDT